MFLCYWCKWNGLTYACTETRAVYARYILLFLTVRETLQGQGHTNKPNKRLTKEPNYVHKTCPIWRLHVLYYCKFYICYCDACDIWWLQEGTDTTNTLGLELILLYLMHRGMVKVCCNSFIEVIHKAAIYRPSAPRQLGLCLFSHETLHNSPHILPPQLFKVTFEGER